MYNCTILLDTSEFEKNLYDRQRTVVLDPTISKNLPDHL